jgi:hypothetical protein
MVSGYGQKTHAALQAEWVSNWTVLGKAGTRRLERDLHTRAVPESSGDGT